MNKDVTEDDKKKIFYNSKYLHQNVAPSPYFKLQFLYLVKKYCKQKPKTVLDLGGGTGEYSIELQQLGYDVTLFDYSHVAINHAKQIGVHNTICNDFLSYDFHNQSYDIILAKGFSLLNTIDEKSYDSVLNKIRNLCNERGVVFYWGRTDLSNSTTKSGWVNHNYDFLISKYNHILLFPAFRWQSKLPHIINIFISRVYSVTRKLYPFTLVGILYR